LEVGVRKRTAADVFVECLEAEGVRDVFGIPGEETLDLNESLDRPSIRFVPVRHEQGGAYIADLYGRLTGRAGVCLGTLGPGATNLVLSGRVSVLRRRTGLVGSVCYGSTRRFRLLAAQAVTSALLATIANRAMRSPCPDEARLSHTGVHQGGAGSRFAS